MAVNQFLVLLTVAVVTIIKVQSGTSIDRTVRTTSEVMDFLEEENKHIDRGNKEDQDNDSDNQSEYEDESEPVFSENTDEPESIKGLLAKRGGKKGGKVGKGKDDNGKGANGKSSFTGCTNKGGAEICYLSKFAGKSSSDICKNGHNKVRKFHKAPNLSWDSKLAASAKKWGTFLATAKKFEHSKSGGKYGENLYTGWTTAPDLEMSCAEATYSWYTEVNLGYNYNNNGFIYKLGHFTQVIWEKSTKIGCSVVKRKDSTGARIIVVCHYSPPGNYIGSFAANCLAPKFSGGFNPKTCKVSDFM